MDERMEKPEKTAIVALCLHHGPCLQGTVADEVFCLQCGNKKKDVEERCDFHKRDSKA
jgi:hypothetical protein